MKNKSRQISYLLRHNPEDLKMDKQGWVSIYDLIVKVGLTIEELEEVVVTNDKKRFGFNEDKSKIRAYQGHSEKLSLNIKFNEIQFPETYYHGTDIINKSSIFKYGINSRTRAYVHLSKDIKTAKTVGFRHGNIILILEIDGNQMKRDGLKIYESENGVILVNEVPVKYIQIKK